MPRRPIKKGDSVTRTKRREVSGEMTSRTVSLLAGNSVMEIARKRNCSMHSPRNNDEVVHSPSFATVSHTAHGNGGRQQSGLGPGITGGPLRLSVKWQAHGYEVTQHFLIMEMSILGGWHHEYRLEGPAAGVRSCLSAPQATEKYKSLGPAPDQTVGGGF